MLSDKGMQRSIPIKILGNLARSVYRIARNTIPDINKVPDLAKFIDSTIHEVIDYHANEMPVFYLFPDNFHSVMKDKSINFTIDKLINDLGLSLIGIEGSSGNINEQYLQDIVDSNEKISSIEQVIQNRPRQKYGMLPDVECIGLENSELNADAGIIMNAISEYHKIIDMSHKQYEQKIKSQNLSEDRNFEIYHSCIDDVLIPVFLLNLEKYLIPFIEPLTYKEELPDIAEGKELWFRGVNSAIQSPFYKGLKALKDKYAIQERSNVAVDISYDTCIKTNQSQMAIIYGLAHLDQIKEGIEQKGASYIVLK